MTNFLVLSSLIFIGFSLTDALKPVACPEGWKGFNNQCFKALPPNGGLTFDAAQATCQKEKAELASVHSEEENNFIMELVKEAQVKNGKSYYWLGLRLTHNKEKVGSASWTDGSKVDFSNPTKQKPGLKPWAKNEPNNFKNEKEECVAMYGYEYYLTFTGEWNDLPCDQATAKYMEAQAGALCKLKA